MRDFEYETFREDKKHTEVAFPYNTYLCSIPLDFSGAGEVEALLGSGICFHLWHFDKL